MEAATCLCNVATPKVEQLRRVPRQEFYIVNIDVSTSAVQFTDEKETSHHHDDG